MTERLEHANISVRDVDAMTRFLGAAFPDFRVRREGLYQGRRWVHVGNDDTYVALFTYPETPEPKNSSYSTKGGLNHWAVVVDDIDATEERVKAEGFTPINHADYEPGKRFYFLDADGIEVEVVQY